MHLDFRPFETFIIPMEPKISDYTVVSEHNLQALIEGVRELLRSGYEPLGSIQMVAPVLNGDDVAPLYAQAMIKRT